MRPEFGDFHGKLQTRAFKPRNLFDQFNVEVLATTDLSISNLEAHQKVIDSDWGGRIIPTFRPDDITDPEHPCFIPHLKKLAEITHEDTGHWPSYLEAIRKRRLFFKSMGATATDHGFPSAFTTILSDNRCQKLLEKALSGSIDRIESELFRGHMLVELARMSCEDGLVIQLHVGCHRNHNKTLFQQFGPDMGGDIPGKVNFVDGLHSLLNEVGNHSNLTLIVFSLDESSYSREIAPLAGHYPAFRIGAAWWFHDSPEGISRYYKQVVETAGFYNTAGFNDDTRAFLSIPARHDVSRRIQCNYLTQKVCEHLLTMESASNLIRQLVYDIPKGTYQL